MPTVAGFDFGGDFGYAVTSDGARMVCGTADLNKRSKRMGVSKASALLAFLRELHTEHRFDHVIYENTIDSFQAAIEQARRDERAKCVVELEAMAQREHDDGYYVISELVFQSAQHLAKGLEQ